jgi:outer membrane protein assembly factor BamB
VVYVQDQDNGGITCFDAATGAQKWYSVVADTGTLSSPVYRKGGIVLFGSKVYKVDAKTGKTDKTYTPDADEYIASKVPAVSDSTVFFSTYSGLYAVDLESFTQKWKKPATRGSNAIVSGNVVYFMSDKVYALNPADGSEYWSIPSPNSENPEGYNMGAVYGNSLVVLSEQDVWGDNTAKLWAYTLNADPKQVPAYRWHAAMGDQMSDDAPPVIEGGRVFANTREGVLKAFDLNGNGTPLWSQTVRMEGNATALPIAVGGKVYTQEEVVGGSMQVVCRDGGTGAVIWQTTEAVGISWSQPALYLNKLFLAADWAGVFAFEAGTPGGNWYMMQQNPALTGSDTGWVPEPLPSEGGFYIIPRKTGGGAAVYLE